MNQLSVRQRRKSIARTMRVFFTALLIASMLLGLIPLPLVTSVVTSIAPEPLAAELVESAADLANAIADALPDAAVAEATPATAPMLAEPSRLDLRASSPDVLESAAAAPALAPLL